MKVMEKERKFPPLKREVPPIDLIEVAIQSAMHGFQNLDTLASVIGRIVDTEAWRHASTARRGKLGPFKSFWDWVTWRLPDGMEASKEKLLAMLEPFQDVKRKVLALKGSAKPKPAPGVVANPTGVNQHTKKEDMVGPTISRRASSESAEGILARLKRDHPEIARAFIEGEYPSAAAAGRAAGISWLQKPSPLEQAQKAFRRLTKEDRDAFDSWRGGLEL
jgi:hypothetical protein